MRMALEDSRSDATATQTLLSEYSKGVDATFATPLHLLAKTPQTGTDSLITVRACVTLFFCSFAC